MNLPECLELVAPGLGLLLRPSTLSIVLYAGRVLVVQADLHRPTILHRPSGHSTGALRVCGCDVPAEKRQDR
jgi:hypothetical protein